MKRFSLATFPLENKTIFLRVDYNVPLGKTSRGKWEVLDKTKIKASLPTIQHLLHKNCKIILATHLGRPNGKYNPALKVDPVAKELKRLLPGEKIIKLDDCIGKEIKQKIAKGRTKQIFLLENLRFYKEEEQNNSIFAHSLASLADIYVNDAFAVSHREHASVDGITHFLPALAGFGIEKEIWFLNKARHPRRPIVWIIGGAKADKINILEPVLKKADYVLIGGALAFAFLKAQNIPIGMSKIDQKSVQTAKKILGRPGRKIFRKEHAGKFVLPVDFVIADTFSPRAKTEIVRYNQIGKQQIGLDLGPETIKLFKRYLRKAQTIVWNGPLGYFEWVKFAAATREIARFLGMLTATTICGGGETAQAIKKFHLGDRMTHVSTGGGASLAFLAGKKLPGISALERNDRRFRKKHLNKKRKLRISNI